MMHKGVCSVSQCPTLWDPMDCSPPVSSVHGILQARALEWAAMSSSRASSPPRIKPSSPALAGGFLTTEPWAKSHSQRFSSFAQLCLTVCNPMDCNMPGLSVHHQLPEFMQTHVHWVGDAIQASYPLSSPSHAFNLSQHQGLFQGASSSHQVAKVLEFQLQHQSFQWIFRTDFL